ncbi:MAG: hypothetical protein KGJ78_10455 [Alphaproteobacteria bacterium]|nr:hypothetical protein [Alphaproteobacteria bacterium]
MFWNIWTTFAFIVAALLFYRFWPRILASLKRFDAQNRARIEAERRDRRDHLAHFRHTLDVAQEQVEEIVEIFETDPRTGTPAARYVFEGVWYASRDEAEQARARKIGDIARGFYRDLPTALTARRGNGKLGRD